MSPGAITDEEASLISQVREAHFPSGTESYGLPLDDAVLVRYLRAREGSIEKAAAMLTATLEWRREFGFPEVFSKEMDVIRKENSTGKNYVSGFDSHGRPILVLRPRCENTTDHDGNIKHIVYQLERTRAILQRTSDGLGKACVIIDYVGFTLRNAPKMKTSMATLNILQNHYPETLGQAFFISPPVVFKGFWKVIYPFIDKDTKEKFTFVPGSATSPAAQEVLAKNFDMDVLEEGIGGKYATKFDSSIYLAAPLDQDYREALLLTNSGTGAS
ncbi:Phosphatidylinositol transfer protein PDR16 [Ectocarpus siliculosus]|uniref:Phosphatidylinositol transfer protein PDR16 n=1 Tax=Ectocarpus siliculosus TaxID=2880 RepID=D7FHL3_ECTSI|nr:Phosphatidylinositol transfer protein PDR16 [Ectocarpus siliculosus]|eukprot:CBJ28570.1 Phosphatidylinositol transfer protein PDR16 [Ectocarpus siliculosus]